jgi:hypothetical protein
LTNNGTVTIPVMPSIEDFTFGRNYHRVQGFTLKEVISTSDGLALVGFDEDGNIANEHVVYSTPIVNPSLLTGYSEVYNVTSSYIADASTEISVIEDRDANAHGYKIMAKDL